MTEEQKERRREYLKKYYAEHKEELAARHAEYYAAHKEELAAKGAAYRATHKEKIAAYNAAYRVTNKEEKAAYDAAYRAAHKEEIAAQRAAYRAENKDKIAAINARYNATKYGRAGNLVRMYNHNDKKRGFDTSNNATAEWIEENIFSGQRCIYCGDSDWTHLGCDRIDNSKPHTPENCVPCCRICNMERCDRYTVEDFVEYRKLNPRTLNTGIEKSWEITELPSGTKVIKKKSIPASA